MRVFVDECPVSVAPGATAVEAIALVDPDMRRAVERGKAYMTDGTGARLAPDASLTAGSILRVVRSAPPEATHPVD